MPRILVADDDPVQLDLRKMLLEAAGHEVSLAQSTVEAVHHLREQGADLVIMDLRFPNSYGTPDSREGLALIRDIHHAGCHTPMMVLSGWPQDLEGQPEEEFVACVLVKPVKPATLMQAIRDIVP
jgi:CheY-like chemotaxis protein